MEVSRRLLLLRAASAFFLLTAIGACGGGGGGGGSKPAPTVTFSANPTTVAIGATTQLTWSTTNATSCTASGGWSGAKATSGNEASPTITAAVTFTLSCTGDGGTRQASVNISLPAAPTVTLTASPVAVHAGATSHLTWSSTGANTCTASDGWAGAKATSGGGDVGPIAATTTYTLACDGDGGSASASATVTFRGGVNLPPTANAGPDQSVLSSAAVTLTGAASSDDNAIIFYTWTQTAGPAVLLAGNPGPSPTFTAPTVGATTVLTFSLVVTDDENVPSAPDTVDITVDPVPATVQIQGDVDYQAVAFSGVIGNGLDYTAQSYLPLHAAVLVEVLDATSGAVLTSGRFAQHYTFTVPSVTNVQLRVTAATSRQAPDPLPHWDVSVRDLDDFGTPLTPVYTFTTASFTTAAGGTHDIQIPSGWDASGALTGTRAAAPFAALDTIEMGIEQVLTVAPTADFPTLTIDWSSSNTGGVTYFAHDGTGRRIVLSGEAGVDTDEYDPGVILHEYGHYVDDVFSRSDNVGGPHSIGDRVDMRLAFGEGLATAFSGIARNNSLYRDSFGTGQHNDGFFNIENDSTLNEGWYSESTTMETLWDLYDSVNDGSDAVSLGFGPLWDVWTGNAHVQTPAMISLFDFFTALKAAQPASAPAIDTLLTGESMVGPGIDIYGSTETNDAGAGTDVLPVYTTIALGDTKVLRSTNNFGTINKLSSHRFLRLTLASTTNVKFDLSAAVGRDPDIQVFRSGLTVGSSTSDGNESFTLPNLTAGDYVLDIYDCGNAGCNDTVAPAPSNLTITVTSN